MSALSQAFEAMQKRCADLDSENFDLEMAVDSLESKLEEANMSNPTDFAPDETRHEIESIILNHLKLEASITTSELAREIAWTVNDRINPKRRRSAKAA